MQGDRISINLNFECDLISQTELFPRVGFIVTNLYGWAGDVIRFYNQRGTAEQ